MALQITKQENQKQASIWDIVQLFFNVDEKYMVVELRGYASEEDRKLAMNGEKVAVLSYRFSLSGADFPDVTQTGYIDAVYAFIKQSNLYGGWSGAVDVEIK